MEKFTGITPPEESMDQYGFNKVHHLDTNAEYAGNADFIILVWSDNQILPAEQYRKANHPDKVVDIAVCQDPNIQKGQLGDKAVIYNFSSQGGGGGGN